VAEGVAGDISHEGLRVLLRQEETGRAPRPRMRVTYTRTAGVRHLFAAYELGEDKAFGHINGA
jgi:hypothetical protein